MVSMKTTTILAASPADREDVYRLRYSCYLRTGVIAPHPSESFSDKYDDLPNQFSFLSRGQDGEANATVRISVVRSDLGWTQAPSTCVFGEHPEFRRIAAGSFVEANRLCFAQQARRDALMGVVGYLAALADFHEVDWLVACPREELPCLRKAVRVRAASRAASVLRRQLPDLAARHRPRPAPAQHRWRQVDERRAFGRAGAPRSVGYFDFFSGTRHSSSRWLR